MKNRVTMLFVFICLLGLSAVQVNAQRKMENLDHGTMAVKTTNGVYVSWRVLGSEWKDVAYNLYRDGVKLNTEPITGATNYSDAAGTTSSSYFVRPVKDGVEKTESCTAEVWAKNYYDIPVNAISGNYSINDASMGDLDGDGDYEIIIKRISHNISDLSKKEYHILQAYHLDPADNINESGAVEPIWSINMGPNLFDATEVNFLVWDLDEDGKAEVITRTSDATVDGLGKDFGDADGDHKDGVTDYRSSVMSGYRSAGPDFLSVFDGETGGEIAREKYIERDPMEQYGSSGGGAAHRSTKCMFTVAYLDGKKPSVVISRGIYERIKMEAWDFDGSSLSKRWFFDTANAPAGYHGSGNHNLSQSDVDYDGKDEIVYGSMVIDDNGKGLNTTGFGHGDALHVSDLNPDRFGQEIWQAGETTYGASFRDGETGEILFRYIGNRDCGRACAGDINPDHRGAEVWAATECPTYTSKGKVINPRSPFPMNFMIYWDGDLLREFLDHDWSSDHGVGNITKRVAGDKVNRLLTASGTLSNNWTKGTPCVSADIFGDWREEVIWRRSDNRAVRVYYSTATTTHRLYTLMHDAQYRAAIGWQMNSYNQPPHPGFFLGHDMDSVPPPSMLSNELVWKGLSAWDESAQSWLDGSTAAAFTAGDDVLFDLSGNNTSAVNITGDISPRSVRVQTPTDYTFAGSGKLSGSMDLIKAGIGKLTFDNDNDYSGITRVYLGKVEVNGNLSKSHVVVKRFSGLYGSGTVGNGVLLQEGSELYCGKENGAASSFNIAGNLTVLGNAKLQFDLSDNADGTTKTNDKVIVAGDVNFMNTNTITINMLDGDLEAGVYELITLTGNFTGDIANIKVAGIPTKSVDVKLKSGALVMEVNAIRSAGNVVWQGAVSSDWDLAQTSNWLNNGAVDYFVGDDAVLFNDEGAANTTINVTAQLPVTSLEINSSLNYTFKGTGSIVGEAGITKKGSGELMVNNNNAYTGVTNILEGELAIPKLTNAGYSSGIGAASTSASNIVLNGGTLAVTSAGNSISNRSFTIGTEGGTLRIPSSTGVVLEGQVVGSGTLIKDGKGTLTLSRRNTHSGGTILREGTIVLGSEDANIGGVGSSITFENGTLQMQNSTGSYTNNCNWKIIVPDGRVGMLRTDGRSQLTGTLTGGGRLNVYTPFVRTDFRGNWSGFTGMLNISGNDYRHYNRYGYPNAHVVVGQNVNFYVENNGGQSVQEMGQLSVFNTGRVSGTGGTFTWKIGGLNTNSLVYGTINDNGYLTIEKVGTGNLVLRGSNVYKRYTNIRGGAVVCDNTAGSATGTSTVNIYSEGTLNGSGSVSGPINVFNGGVLAGKLSLGGVVKAGNGGAVAPGGKGKLGTLQMTKTLTLNEGSIYAVDLNSDSEACDKSVVSGVVTLSGVLSVLNLGSSAYEIGDKFKIMESATIKGQFASVEPSRPADGMDWDLSDIQSGYLGVIKATSVNALDANKFSVMPNPSQGMFTVRFDEYLQEARYQLIDVSGKIIKSDAVNGADQVRIDMLGAKKGIYLLKVFYNDKMATKVVVLN